MGRPLFALMLAGALVAGCGGSHATPSSSAGTPTAAPTPAPALEGTDWRLLQLAGSGVPFIDVPAGVNATLRIDGAKAGGKGGCNQWFADVAVDGASIMFDQVGSTMMACPEPAMSIESAWLGYLPQIASWSITGGRLELADPNGAVLLAFAHSPTFALEGTDWRLTQVWSQGALAPVPADVTATLSLAGGRASGSAGCAQLFGGYTLSGDALAFAGLMSGAMLCPEPQMSVQEAYLAVLGTVAAWQTDGATLQLLDASGQVVATFTPAPTALLVGDWQAINVRDGQGVNSVEGTKPLTARFGADGTISGDAGCNTFLGPWKQDGDAIAIGPLASPKMACVDEALTRQETAYLAALERSTSWTSDAPGGLTLHAANGDVTVVFVVDPVPVQ